jgi:hypothetical protein
MGYSQYFDFSSGPELKTGTSKWIKAGALPIKVTYNYVSDGMDNKEANDAFDKIMAGHDATTQKYVNTLKSIYDNYEQYSKDYEGNVKPIIDALGGDIESMDSYISEFENSLSKNKDAFLNGIAIDPNAARTRAEYTGAVSDQYRTSREKLKRDMASQGLNPYANTGADRELELKRAEAMGMASGKAYSDWRQGYNRDKQAQQAATGTYLGLMGRAGDMRGSILNARAGIGDMYKGVLNSKLAASKERATGYEGLTSLAEARRQEALSLAQQQQENVKRKNDIKQQLSAKLTSRDKNIAAHGSEYGGSFY